MYEINFVKIDGNIDNTDIEIVPYRMAKLNEVRYITKHFESISRLKVWKEYKKNHMPFMMLEIIEWFDYHRTIGKSTYYYLHKRCNTCVW